MSSGARITIWALALLLAFLLSFIAGYRRAMTRPVEPRRDTVTVVRVDTMFFEGPERPVFIRVVDTMLLAVHDTARVRDSIYIPVPREQAYYEDSTYRAWVSGYKPRLDSLQVFSPVKTVTITERVPVEVTRRWGLGISAGCGATVSGGTVQLSPYVGVGINYSIVSW